MENFHTGDVVKYVGKDTFWRQEEIHIIHESKYLGKGEFEYSTNQGAWFVGEDFVLIHRANKESFEKLDKFLIEEGFEEIEEE